MKNFNQLVLLVMSYISLAIAQYGNPCTTAEGKQGSCIDILQCPSIDNLFRMPNLSPADQSYLRRSQCGYFRNPYVCCPPSDDTKSESSPTFPPPTQPTQPTQSTPSNPITSRLSVDDLPPLGTCGRSGLQSYIIGGTETAINEFPWMALIEYTKPRNEKGFHCGGVLINKDYVLTASHCVNGRELTKYKWKATGVRLGEWDLSSPSDCDDGNCSDPPLDVPIVEWIPHEDYDPNARAQQNDIALLRLERSVPFTEWIKPICLPVSADLNGKNFNNETLVVSGWGRTETGKNLLKIASELPLQNFLLFARSIHSQSNIKLKVELSGIPTDECNTKYRQKNVVLTGKQLCAGGEFGKDSCRGDSGGPLMIRHQPDPYHAYYYLTGVVSFGLTPCGLEGWPGVYTRVDQFTDWILSHMKP